MRAKFQIKDRVRFAPRVCQYATQGLRQRTRTIVDAHYDPQDQCVYYELGNKGKATLDYLFRSYMLRFVTKRELHTVGKPRQKRKYSLHRRHLEGVK